MLNTNLGIYASSFRTAGTAPSLFTLGSAIPATSANQIAFINGTAVIQGNGPVTRYSGDIFTSSTAGGTLSTTITAYGMTAANGAVISFGGSALGTVSAVRSLDGGLTWATALNNAATGSNLAAGAYGDVSGTARWIAPVSNDNDIWLSTNNGSTWAFQSGVLGATGFNWGGAVRFGTAFAVFNDTTTYYTSTAGVTWTSRTLPATPGAQANNAGGFVAGTAEVMYVRHIGAGSISSYTSTDLVNWTTRGTIVFTAGTPDQGIKLAFGNGYWVMAFGDDQATDFIGVAYSSDTGTTWTAGSVSGSANFVNGGFDIEYNSTDKGFYIVNGSRVWRALT